MGQAGRAGEMGKQGERGWVGSKQDDESSGYDDAGKHDETFGLSIAVGEGAFGSMIDSPGLRSDVKDVKEALLRSIRACNER